jgi:hypothetical protein
MDIDPPPPHVGRHRCQVMPLREATSPRIISGTIHLNAKNAREPKRTPERREENSGIDGNAMEAPTDLYKLTISNLAPLVM